MNSSDRGPRRIAFVLTAVWEGGLERFTCDLIDGMDRTRFQPHLYVLTGNNPWLHAFQERNVVIQVFDGRNEPRLRTLLPLARTLVRLAAAMRRDRIDLVHTCDFLPAAMGRTASLLAGVPRRVHTLHSLYDWYPAWARFLNRMLAARTDLVTAVSASAAEVGLTQDRIPSTRLRVVLNGSNTERFRPLPLERDRIRAELGLAPDDILIGSVGSLTTRKAHHLLVEAVAPLCSENPRLKVAIFGAAHGGPQDDLARVKDAIARHGLGERVRIHAPRSDVERLFAAFDLYCMPSTVEGLSLASVEAQLCGCLSVLSDIGPFHEVVRDGVNGMLFRSGDVDDLRTVLRKALALPPEDASRMRAAAAADARTRFDKSRMVADYLEIYRSLLAEEHT